MLLPRALLCRLRCPSLAPLPSVPLRVALAFCSSPYHRSSLPWRFFWSTPPQRWYANLPKKEEEEEENLLCALSRKSTLGIFFVTHFKYGRNGQAIDRRQRATWIAVEGCGGASRE